jgi:hypothetical protein
MDFGGRELLEIHSGRLTQRWPPDVFRTMLPASREALVTGVSVKSFAPTEMAARARPGA